VTRTIRSPRLSEALGIRRGDLAAFVGAGGKTGAILTLTGELTESGWEVLASTTTKVGMRLGSGLPLILAGAAIDGADHLPIQELITEALRESGCAFVAVGETDDHKLSGVPSEWLTGMRSDNLADAILVEADGARQRSLKLPGAHEPVIPSGTDIVVPIAGLDVLGKEIGQRTAHRHELVRAYAGSSLITEELFIRIMTDETAGLKGLPDGARCVPMLTRARPSVVEAAGKIASGILLGRPDRIDRVVLADLRERNYSIVIRAEQ
jgi:probable selenium-dependent hydroxylase accessory protein YqeC